MHLIKTISIIIVWMSFIYCEESVTCTYFKESEILSRDSALIINGNVLKINSKYFKDLETTENGYAVWSCEKCLNVFINKKGKIIVWGVPYFENGADYFNNGLIRIIRNNKYGYANKNGKIIVTPIYDGALPFNNGIAKACIGCKDTCVENSDCEHHYFKGGNWFLLDTLGNIIEGK